MLDSSEQGGAFGSRIQFSVVVPVFEQWHLINDLMTCLRQQSFSGGGVEFIIVDNAPLRIAPEDGSLVDAIVVHCPTPGSYAARNQGAQRAMGEWLVFTDADCRPHVDWLQSLHEFHSIEKQQLVMAGAVDTVAVNTQPGMFEVFDIVRGIPQDRYVRRGYGATANLAVARAVFWEIGGFRSSRFSGGDADFCRRASASGYPTLYAPRARVRHLARSSWSEIANKERRLKGGQLVHGSRRNRMMWYARALTPPSVGVWRLFRARQHPMRSRLVAIGVLYLVWTVGLIEAFRLTIGGQPQRR